MLATLSLIKYYLIIFYYAVSHKKILLSYSFNYFIYMKLLSKKC